MRAAATGVAGRALPGSTFGCSGWWRAGTPSQPHCLLQGLGSVAAAPFPSWQLQCPWELAQFNSSSLFAGSGILQGLLRGSSALGTGNAANTGDGALPCKAPHSCGVHLFHCSWSQLSIIFQCIYDNYRSNSSTSFGEKKCNKHTLQFAQNFSTAQAKISLYVLRIYLK